jgi:hypothetical protein
MPVPHPRALPAWLAVAALAALLLGGLASLRHALRTPPGEAAQDEIYTYTLGELGKRDDRPTRPPVVEALADVPEDLDRWETLLDERPLSRRLASDAVAAHLGVLDDLVPNAAPDERTGYAHPLPPELLADAPRLPTRPAQGDFVQPSRIRFDASGQRALVLLYLCGDAHGCVTGLAFVIERDDDHRWAHVRSELAWPLATAHD